MVNYRQNIHRVGDNTSDMRVGTMRIVTVCYRLVRLVARRALPRHVPVARHFKLIVPGVRADDLASPEPRREANFWEYFMYL